MKDVIFIIKNLFLHNEIICTNSKYYIFMGLQPDIPLPKETIYFIANGILDPFSGNLETGDVSYMLTDNLKEKLKNFSFNDKFDKKDFLEAIRNYRLIKLEI